MTHPTISKEQVVQLAREAGFKQRLNNPEEWWMHTPDIERLVKAAFKLGRNAGLEESIAEASHWQTLSSSHKCGFYIAAAIKSLKDNTL